jgi:hypothetical protein
MAQHLGKKKPQQAMGLRQRLKRGLLRLASGGRAKQLKNLEQRQSNPSKREQVVVRPDRKP